MKAMLGLSAMLLALSLLAGCAGMLYVQMPPPPLEVEVRPPPPTDVAVWVDGYWAWNGDNYYWVPGRWEARPRGAWVPGRWDHEDRGYYWVKGHWDRGQGKDRGERRRGDQGDHDRGRGGY